MTRDVQENGSSGLSRAGDALQSERLDRFLHCGHVFSAAVREILEARYLAEVTPEPLTVSQFNLLKLIALRGERQVGEMADMLGISSPAVSKIIDKLESKGLVTRSAATGDRRVTLVSASRKGSRLVRRYEELKAARLGPVLDVFTPEEVDQLSKLLERFSLSLYSRESTGDGFCLRCAAYGAPDCAIRAVDGVCPYERNNGGMDKSGPVAGQSAT
jgi:DNA-binding MarR family transcriptional regulator